jgi:hypothetical protein
MAAVLIGPTTKTTTTTTTVHLHVVQKWWNSGEKYHSSVRKWNSQEQFGRITTSHITYISRIKISSFFLDFAHRII